MDVQKRSSIAAEFPQFIGKDYADVSVVMISAANFKNIGLIRSGPGDLVTS